ARLPPPADRVWSPLRRGASRERGRARLRAGRGAPGRRRRRPGGTSLHAHAGPEPDVAARRADLDLVLTPVHGEGLARHVVVREVRGGREPEWHSPLLARL